MQNVKILLKGGATGTQVWVDGVEQSNLVSVEVSHRVKHVPVVTLKSICYEGGEIAGEAEVRHLHLCAKCRKELKRADLIDSTSVTDSHRRLMSSAGTDTHPDKY